MTKTVLQLRLEACAIKELHPVASKKKLRAAVCGRRISLFRHVHHLGTIRQQSEQRNKTRLRMADDPERLEVRGTSGYNVALARPGGRMQPANISVETQTYQ